MLWWEFPWVTRKLFSLSSHCSGLMHNKDGLFNLTNNSYFEHWLYKGHSLGICYPWSISSLRSGICPVHFQDRRLVPGTEGPQCLQEGEVDRQVGGIEKRIGQHWTEEVIHLVSTATSKHPSIGHDLKGAILLQGCYKELCWSWRKFWKEMKTFPFLSRASSPKSPSLAVCCSFLSFPVSRPSSLSP